MQSAEFVQAFVGQLLLLDVAQLEDRKGEFRHRFDLDVGWFGHRWAGEVKEMSGFWVCWGSCYGDSVGASGDSIAVAGTVCFEGLSAEGGRQPALGWSVGISGVADDEGMEEAIFQKSEVGEFSALCG